MVRSCARAVRLGLLLGISASAVGQSIDDPCEAGWSNIPIDPKFAIGQIKTLLAADAQRDPVLIVGGWLQPSPGQYNSGILQWDGIEWTVLGESGGLLPIVHALAQMNKSESPAIIAGGVEIDPNDGSSKDLLDQWNGTQWTPLASPSGVIRALQPLVDSPPYQLATGGMISSIDGVPANNVAVFDGESWSPLGQGTNGTVEAICEFAVDGTMNIIVAGNFTQAGGKPLANIARWDGQTWHALGPGIDGTVRSLQVFDDGSGPALYVAGSFTSAGNIAASNIARWDGREWSALRMGTSDSVYDMEDYDDGAGPVLVVGGTFLNAGGSTVNRIGVWDGRAWSALGAGVTYPVTSLAAFPSPDGPSLVAGGFVHISGAPVIRLRQWRSCTSSPAPADLNDDGIVNAQDLIILLSAWGECAVAGGCAADLTGDGLIDAADLLALLATWDDESTVTEGPASRGTNR